MSPLTPKQVDFEEGGNHKLSLKQEYFIKENVSLILFLLTIFPEAIGRILTNIQQCTQSCSCQPDPNNFLPNQIQELISCFMHTETISHH